MLIIDTKVKLYSEFYSERDVSTIIHVLLLIEIACVKIIQARISSKFCSIFIKFFKQMHKVQLQFCVPGQQSAREKSGIS